MDRRPDTPRLVLLKGNRIVEAPPKIGLVTAIILLVLGFGMFLVQVTIGWRR